MAPRRRPPPVALWLGAAAATTLAAGLAWAYLSLQDARPSDDEQPAISLDATPASKPKPRSGPRPALVLCSPSFPPASLIARLTPFYTLHLVIPSPAGQPLSLPASYASTDFESKRLIPHETPEGVIHVVRALGGTVVFINGRLEAEEEREGFADGVRIGVERLVRETRTFVRGVLVVNGEGKEELGKEAKGVSVVEGWEELARVSGV